MVLLLRNTQRDEQMQTTQKIKDFVCVCVRNTLKKKTTTAKKQQQ